MEVTRTFDLLDRYLEKFNKEDVLAGKRDGKWETFSAEDYYKYSTFLSYGFMELGFKPGDKIATIFNNRPEWNFVDMALAMAGIVHIPLYPSLHVSDYKYMLSHADAEAIIISNNQLYKRIKPAIDETPNIKQIFTIDQIEGEDPLIEVVKLGAKMEEKHREALIQLKASISPDDLLTIIYTSGTTGDPKGVMLSHKNLITNAISTSKVQPIDHRHKVISFLPLCHVYERMMNYHQQYKGISIYYAESLGTVFPNLKEVSADGFNAVPRVLEKMYDKLYSAGKNLSGIKRMIYFSAFRLGLRYDHAKQPLWYRFLHHYADKLVYSKWRENLGGKKMHIVCGGSSIQPRIVRLLSAAGLGIYEGYGLTETSPVIAVSDPVKGSLKIGTVGPILENVEVMFAEDGEILTRGPNLMLGYYKDPEYTRQVINKDGWFHTGDIGELIDGQYLKITDRKKEIFKLSAGKYIAPQVLENKLVESIFIESSCIIGEGDKFASVLVSPNFNHLHYWAAKRKLSYRDNTELISLREVVQRYQKEVDKINKNLAPHEQIKRFRLVCEEWSNATGELSPTLKLKRAVIHKKYDHIIKEIYNTEKHERDFLPRININYKSWNIPNINLKDINLKAIKFGNIKAPQLNNFMKRNNGTDVENQDKKD